MFSVAVASRDRSPAASGHRPRLRRPSVCLGSTVYRRVLSIDEAVIEASRLGTDTDTPAQ